ncbi:hypothetical protein HC823_01655 [Candidatus Gracilibacteria bacterium]|nr:hypothetical protein [Candidatus Gracilibacteria bacterium]
MQKSSAPLKKEAPLYSTNIPKVKVKITGFDKAFAEVSTTADTELWERENKIATIPSGQTIKIFRQIVNDEKFIKVSTDTNEWLLGKNSLGRISLKTNGVLTINNYRNPRFGSERTQYNSFRRILHFYPNAEKTMLVVNELPIEEYLWGLGEEPSDEPVAKKHAIFTLARSYALVYSTQKRKFNTDLYDLEDDPATSQLYLGHDWERYHVEQKKLIAETEEDVLTHKGLPVIGPYFTQSAGRSSDKWSSQYPWCRARELPYDKGLTPKGHGVGLSGHSARILAEKGKTTEEILQYFFTDVDVRGAY